MIVNKWTRGHDVVGEGWAGASHPQLHPNHTPNTPPTPSHTNNTNRSILNTRLSRFQLEHDKLSVNKGRTEKASYRVATKISYVVKQARLGKDASGLCLCVYWIWCKTCDMNRETDGRTDRWKDWVVKETLKTCLSIVWFSIGSHRGQNQPRNAVLALV